MSLKNDTKFLHLKFFQKTGKRQFRAGTYFPTNLSINFLHLVRDKRQCDPFPALQVFWVFTLVLQNRDFRNFRRGLDSYGRLLQMQPMTNTLIISAILWELLFTMIGWFLASSKNSRSYRVEREKPKCSKNYPISEDMFQYSFQTGDN